jgi:hypothetical protein
MGTAFAANRRSIGAHELMEISDDAITELELNAHSYVPSTKVTPGAMPTLPS